MTKQLRRGAVLLLCGGLLLWFLGDPDTVRQAAWEGLRLCARSAVPALFPFLAVTGLLISQGFGEWASPLFSSLMALYRLPGAAGSALALGFLGGYPVGAKAAADLYRRRALTREEAERLLGFCNNANPAFLISVLGAGVFESVRAGIWLLCIHMASALLTGFLFRGTDRPSRKEIPLPPDPPEPFLTAFVNAVTSAAGSMVRICGFVTFFYVLASPLRDLPWPWAALGTGCLELFSLTPLLSPDAFGFVAAAAFSAWGGLGVQCQTAAAIADSGLSLRNCVPGKAAQAVIAAGLAGIAAGWVL